MEAGDQEIQQLENFCKDLYETTVPATRAEAEKILLNFQNSVNFGEAMTKCRLLLERGVSSYAQLLASSTLIKLVSRPVPVISLQERLQIKNYVLNYLLTRGKLDVNVLRSLQQLYARVVKNSWFDKDDGDQFLFQNVVADATPFLQGSNEQCQIGIQLLSTLTNEITQFQDIHTSTYLSKQRRVAASFKGTALIEIFKIAHTYLQVALGKPETLTFDNPAELTVVNELLKLAESCLSTQIPSNWKSDQLEASVFQPFIDLYFVLPLPISHKALTCLTEASALGKYCVNERKQEFLKHLLAGVTNILRRRHGLAESANYHEFCKLIDALKNNYQITQLVNTECYSELIQLVAKLTLDSLRELFLYASNSVHFLLQFWQNMASSIAYLQLSAESRDHQLEKYLPEITNSYITTRLDNIAKVISDHLENPLDDETVLEQEMEQFSVIGRCDFPATVKILLPTFDSTAQAYQELLQRSNRTPTEMQVIEEKLTWLVRMIAATICGRLSFYFKSEHDALDGDLASRVFGLMQLTDARLTQQQGGRIHLEEAYLAFFEKFRRTCMGDGCVKANLVYERMNELVRLDSEAVVFAYMIRKIVTNLKFWSNEETILEPTIQLLNELSIGNNGHMRKFVKLEEIQILLNNHTGGYFPFLGLNKIASDLKRRTQFYKALGRFVIIDSLDDKAVFNGFMAPFSATFQLLDQTLSNTETALHNSEETKWTLVGLARDLRGIVRSFVTRPPYLLFFEWMCPAFFPIFERGMQLWCHDPDVTIPILKFYNELVYNRNDRLYFGDLSPNSVILFREASKVMCMYGARDQIAPPIGENIKPQTETVRLREITLCFRLLRTAMCSHFVNFGVMRFYKDETIDNALNCFIKLTVSISVADLTQNPKLAQAYYGLLRYLGQDHIKFICSLVPDVFLYILQTVVEGSASPDVNINSDALAVMDYITTYLFQETVLIKEKKQTLIGNENFLRILQTLEQRPEILQQMLATLLNHVLFEDCKNQWSTSRPLLGLILLNEEYYCKLQAQLVASQPVDKQAIATTLFASLLDGIERNLSGKNKDSFICNLINFRRTICGT